MAKAAVGMRGAPVRRGRRGLVVASLVLLLCALGVLYGLVPAATEEEAGAYRYVAAALLTVAAGLLIAAAVTARPPR